ncbi:MAG: hypothetical protein HKN43_10190 [Rhodothermales bacterium]|nr:hypothetical protein [Rhodothermales bacterium]
MRIGDDWNAITIIALSQSNPLKAVAEFVENSIDAGASDIEIIRGREKKEAYLRIRDNGRGVPRDDEGLPNFRYVATHICDSIKRQLKVNGSGSGLQGEFGIGLLSFWTVGETLIMRSPSEDGKSYEMRMAKGDPNYTIVQRRSLFAEHGTELTIKPLLTGLRQFSGEKIQWYLASELRDRIRQSGATITVTDRHARKQFVVEPRKFDGRLITELQVSDNAYLEIYLTKPGQENGVGLYRSGTRVLTSITELDALNHAPWNSPYLQGIVDAPKMNLTPGTRLGVIQDEHLAQLIQSLKPSEAILIDKIEDQRRAEEERASKQILHTITKAFREALITLPAEEYDWFDLENRRTKNTLSEKAKSNASSPNNGANESSDDDNTLDSEEPSAADIDDRSRNKSTQKEFFEFTGPLTSVRITPTSSVIKVGATRTFRAVARDNQKRQIDREVLYQWRILEGTAELTNTDGEVVSLTAPSEPGLIRIGLTATEGDLVCEAEALVTVTETLMESSKADGDNKQGLPAYSFRRAAGELWRSRFDSERNLIIVNSGHRDFVYSSKTNALKLRYICRLYAKELVLKNFPGLRPDQLLERMLEISLYTEENLR